MDVLVLYRKFRLVERATIRYHLYSLKRYAKECNFVYLNVDGPAAFKKAVLEYPFDAVVFHYTFLAMRFDKDFDEQYSALREKLQSLRGYKVFVVHDEYVFTRALWRMIRELNIEHVYATCYPEDYETIFPVAETGKPDLCSTVFPGYVEERLVRRLRRKICRPRKIDVGYRALRSSYSFGEHGQLKTEVAEKVSEALAGYPEIRADIRMTEEGYVNTIVGNRWFDYLCSCRATIGCLGGSSLLDPDGRFRTDALNYIRLHPQAGYAEVEHECYPGRDHSVRSHLFGPKIFECAMTKTCQILMEDDYQGILVPGVDFIQIARDFSNLQQVIERLKDKTYCAEIAQRCYEHIVAAEKYTYRSFAQILQADLKRAAAPGKSNANISRLRARILLRDLLCSLKMVPQFVKQQIANMLWSISPRLYKRLRARRHAGEAESA